MRIQRCLTARSSGSTRRSRIGAAHELVTVPGGKHGGFTDAEQMKNYAAIRAFLTKHNLLTGEPRAKTSD